MDQTQLRHLRREVRTALELSVVALAPGDLIDELAAAAGLLEAVEELPATEETVMALASNASRRAAAALKRWQGWREQKGPRG